MKTMGTLRTAARRSPLQNLSGFSLIELLVIVAVLCGLIVLLFSLSSARVQARQAQCRYNLKQWGLALQNYGSDFTDHLPSVAGGDWAWDIPIRVADLQAKYGASSQLMYCPMNPEMNTETNWNHGRYRRIGYATALAGSATVDKTNQIRQLFQYQVKDLGFSVRPPPRLADIVLLADAVISYGNDETNRATNQYVGITNGWSKPYRSSHVSGRIPFGGNLGMLDGYVEYRAFDPMHVRTVGYPYFWW